MWTWIALNKAAVAAIIAFALGIGATVITVNILSVPTTQQETEMQQKQQLLLDWQARDRAERHRQAGGR